jgi:hypothetical protein
VAGAVSKSPAPPAAPMHQPKRPNPAIGATILLRVKR